MCEIRVADNSWGIKLYFPSLWRFVEAQNGVNFVCRHPGSAGRQSLMKSKMAAGESLTCRVFLIFANFLAIQAVKVNSSMKSICSI